MNYNNIIKKQSSIIAISVIGMCIILISTSYALFMKVNTSTNNQVVESGTLVAEYTTGTTLTTAELPQSDTDGLATTGYTFSVTNKGSLPMSYEITVYNDPDVDLTNAIPQQYLRVSLDGSTPVSMSSLTKTSDTSSETNENNIKYVLKSGLGLAASGSTGDVKTHNVKIWIDETAPESIIGKTVAIEISVNGEVGDGLPLADTLLNAAGGTTAIDAKSTPDFSKSATTDEGMFKTMDGYGTTYYYRGAVTTNNVLFGGFCWKVIRINGNGTTRMIYNGPPTNDQCDTYQGIDQSYFNTSSDDNAYVGYMYGATNASTYEATHANTNSSAIKNVIDNWYLNNLLSYSSKISDSSFCDNRSSGATGGGDGYAKIATTYSKYKDLVTNKMTYPFCATLNDDFTVKDTDNGNAKLTYPIGLLSAEEIAIAGGVYNTANNLYYLYAGKDYWTITPALFEASSTPVAENFYVSSGGALNYISVNYNSKDIRPVINLNSDVTYVSGNGTVSLPYVISE